MDLEKFAVVVLVCLSMTRSTSGQVAFIHNQRVWESIVSSPEYFDFTAANTALALEVEVAPRPNAGLGGILSFDAALTGLSSNVVVETVQARAGFTFADTEGGAAFRDALSVGDIDNFQNDDFRLTFDGAPVYALAIDLRHNSSHASERLHVYSGDEVLGTQMTIPGGEFAFIGVVSEAPISQVVFDEDSGGDDIAVGGFGLSNRPLPQVGCDYRGIYFPGCVNSFASQVLRYEPLFSGGPPPANTTNSPEALGWPNNVSVPLGSGGLIELEFAEGSITNSGDDLLDLHVFEVGGDVEDAFVAIRPTLDTRPLLDASLDSNGDGFYEVGKVFGATGAIDLDAVFRGFARGQLRFDAVQLVDDPNEGSKFGAAVGADIDAVGALAFARGACDYDANGVCDVQDLNTHLAIGPVADGVEVVAELHDRFDWNGDLVVDNADVDLWLAEAAATNGLASTYLRGDANLDGQVDATDHGLWSAHRFLVTTNWDHGDFNGDGVSDGSDFNLWNDHRDRESPGNAVPEPPSLLLLALLALMSLPLRRWYQ